MVHACDACPLRQRGGFRPLAPEQIEFIQRMKQGERRYEPGATLMRPGARHAELYTMLEGWAFRYKTLDDGSRQILNFLMPGDLIGLQRHMEGEASHGVEALTAMNVCVLDGKQLWMLYGRYPELAYDVTWLACAEESLVDENLLSVGRRSALRRVATLLHTLYQRLRSLPSDGSPPLLPLTQQHIADALGLSVAHTQRSLRSLRRQATIDTSRGAVQVIDEKELARLAGTKVGESQPRALL